jgi:chaperonin GroES
MLADRVRPAQCVRPVPSPGTLVALGRAAIHAIRRGETDMSSLRPLNDKVIVRRLDAEEKTKGGIILPEKAKEKPREGIVKAVGDGKLLDNGKRASIQVKSGDRVIFSSYAGSEIKVDGDELLILGEEDILAIVE